MDFLLQLYYIVALPLDRLQNRAHRSLVSEPHVVHTRIIDVFWTLFIDCIVGQVHVQIVYIALIGGRVFLGGESG